VRKATGLPWRLPRVTGLEGAPKGVVTATSSEESSNWYNPDPPMIPMRGVMGRS
jgi:hypothetical protein